MPYTPYLWKDDLAGGTPITAARLNVIENAISAAQLTGDTVATSFGAVAAGEYKPLAGTGIDLTGVADSTTAVQTLFNGLNDGDVLVVPPGATIKMTATITVTKRLRITGKGKLYWAGIPNSAAMIIKANGTFLDGIYMQGDGNAAQSGVTQYGIRIEANSVRVIGCHIDNLQQSISVAPNGEWYNNVISNNIVSNVPGSGDGASNTTSSLGEDRGDGIVNWGASCVISGNRVSAKDGQDCRIGIHTEGLVDQETVTTYPHRDQVVSITGNVVTGKFRRGIVSEQVSYVTITGNVVADVTWWAFAFINTVACVVANNTVKWTRTSSDNQGAYWAVNRAAIMAYSAGSNNIIMGNTLAVVAGANMPYGIYAQPDSLGNQDDLLISNNTITDTTGNLNSGIYLNGNSYLVNRPRVLNNRIGGFQNNGIYGWSNVDPEIRGNRIDGVTNNKNGSGIRQENGSTGFRVDDNTINWADTALLLTGRNSSCTANGNLIQNTNTGINLYGTAGASVIGNRILTTTTAVTNMPTGYINVGNNY